MGKQGIAAREPRWNQHGTIDLDVDLPGVGWCPFTAHPDEGSLGPALYARAVAGEFGKIAPYEPPPMTREEKIDAARQAIADAYRIDPPEDLFERLTALEIIARVRDPIIDDEEEEEA